MPRVCRPTADDYTGEMQVSRKRPAGYLKAAPPSMISLYYLSGLYHVNTFELI